MDDRVDAAVAGLGRVRPCGLPGPTITVPSSVPAGERLAQVRCVRPEGHDGDHQWYEHHVTRRVRWSGATPFRPVPGDPVGGLVRLPLPKADTRGRRF